MKYDVLECVLQISVLGFGTFNKTRKYTKIIEFKIEEMSQRDTVDATGCRWFVRRFRILK